MKIPIVCILMPPRGRISPGIPDFMAHGEADALVRGHSKPFPVLAFARDYRLRLQHRVFGTAIANDMATMKEFT